MQIAFGLLVIAICVVWAAYEICEMLGLFSDDKIDHCPHCGDWVCRGENVFVDDNEIYHGYCWDQAHGHLKGLSIANK